jgi:hypothetical protein
MSLFGSMLEKLGLRKKEHTQAPATHAGGAAASRGSSNTASTPKPRTPAGSTAPSPSPSPSPAKPAANPTPAQPAKPAPMAEVDVVKKLEGMAASSSQPLNWRTSIVDLMKLLGMDSSLAERKALATELGCPAEFMNDSARMNVWLHKEVLRQIAQNGGNVPAELYD